MNIDTFPSAFTTTSYDEALLVEDQHQEADISSTQQQLEVVADADANIVSLI